MRYFFVFVVVAFAAAVFAEDQPVFKSDVAMARVDSQVVDRQGRAITGLQASDFLLHVDGRTVPIRNFANENMPIDILLLLDVSGSMRPHVQRIADAANEALSVLAPRDRVAIMVFDTSARVRLPFRNNHRDITDELDQLLRSERFNRGTHITGALLDAAKYLQREARPEARRAIVILTDDETQDAADEGRVESALARANAVLSFLQAPYEVPGMGGGRRRGPWGRGGSWPGGIGWPGGGPVILGPGRGGPLGGQDRSHSAGTATIASDSGGDTMQVSNASSLEDTFARLRQRYALYFYLPEGSNATDQRAIQVDLSEAARARYQDAETKYRRVFIMAGDTGNDTAATVVSRRQASAPALADNAETSADSNSGKRRRVAVDDNSGPRVNSIDGPANSNPNPTPATNPPAQAPAANAPSNGTANTPAPQHGGWPRATPQNTNSN